MKYPTRVIQTDIREIEKEKIGKFGVIVADCPWQYDFEPPSNQKILGNKVGRRPNEVYDGQLSVNELCKLPITDICLPNSVLYLWGVWAHVPECLQVMQAWGFKQVSGFPWIKISKRFVFHQVGGYWVFGVSEFVLIGKKGKPSPPPPDERYLGIICDNFTHSKKPNSVHEIAETLPGPYLELFAREAREGWTCIGNQIDGSSKRIEKNNHNNMKMF